MPTPLTIIGIQDCGCAGMTDRERDAIQQAQVLAGGARHLAFFPDFSGEKIELGKNLLSTVKLLAEYTQDRNVCVLASGDPMFFGVGSLLIKHVGAEHVQVFPHASSMQLAFARVGLKWDDAKLVSVHGRSLSGLVAKLRQFSKAGIFTDSQKSPAQIAAHFMSYGEHDWNAWVCEHLDGSGERVRRFTLAELAACDDIDPLNVLVLQRNDPAWQPPSSIPFLHEEDFAKKMPRKGLITKREVRLMALAQLGINQNSVMWDIGSGSGSVSIEASFHACNGRVYAIECEDEGVEYCRQNVLQFGADNVSVIHGRAPDVLDQLPDPHCIFVGGSKGSMSEIINISMKRLLPGGRLVVNAITLENITLAYSTIRALGLKPEVTMLNTSRAVPLAHYMRYEAQNPIQIFAVQKPASGTEEIA